MNDVATQILGDVPAIFEGSGAVTVLENVIRVAMLAGIAGSGAPALAQEATDWSGFYAAVYAGYGLDNARSISSTSVVPPVDLGGGNTLSYSNVFDLTRIEGLLGGVGAGYNIQHNQLVLGLEGAFHLGHLSKTEGGSEMSSLSDGVDTLSASITNANEFAVDWYSTFTGTVGVAFEPGWMAYVKGGAAVANISTSSAQTINITTTDPAFFPVLPAGNFSATNGSSGLVFGPSLGVGVEKQITESISIGAEYNYVGLPSVTANRASALALFGGGAPSQLTLPMGFHTARATLKYHF